MTSIARATDRSPTVQRSRTRSARQQKAIIDAARRLIDANGAAFTTQDLIKEAGIAIQTFYRHFAGKDEFLLALLETLVAEQVVLLEEQARSIPDPIARLHFYITFPLRLLNTVEGNPSPRFTTAEHWRLQQIFPDEVAQADQPFADLLERELRLAQGEGLLRPSDAARDAWFAMHVVMSVYHRYAFATAREPIEDIAEQLWMFCLDGFGGTPGAAE